MTGTTHVFHRVNGLSRLASTQHGVCSRAQLRTLGLTSDHIGYHVAARRWRLLRRDVVVLHRGPLTLAARSWAAVLGAPDGVAIGAWFALHSWGLPGGHATGCTSSSRAVSGPTDTRGSSSMSLASAPGRHRSPRGTPRAPRGAAASSGGLATVVATAGGLMAAAVQQELTTPND